MKLTLALMALFVLAGAQAAQDPLAEALRKGVVQEDTNQNLDAAIQAYQSVLTQFGEERKTAATALFRLAECYRKQGKNEPAMAAYKRVVVEFADQTKLAEQSRTVLARTFKVQPPQAAGATSPQTEEARRRYRELLETQVASVQANVKNAEKKWNLGVNNIEDVMQTKMQLIQVERRLAELDFGPAGPSTAKARLSYRTLLESQVKLMQDQWARVQRYVELGSISELDVKTYQLQLLQAQAELAAFDAGITQR